MLRNNRIFALAVLLLAFVFSTTSCIKDIDDPTNNNPTTGRARIEITDAAIDDPYVKGVFITVVDVKVDGKSWEGFDGKTTFDLLAYQKGETKLLGEGELDIKSFNEVILVLDTETDANGNSPGCYVQDSTNAKKKLNGGNQLAVKVKGNFETKANETTEAIIDMDLRKSVIYQTGSTTEFSFVTDPELSAAMRLMNKSNTGSIAGDFTDVVSGSDKVIVYAYKKGDYSVNTEKFPQGSSQIQFKNAVTSSVVEAGGAFKLSFLESGNYELHFISYKKQADGRLKANGELQVNLLDAAYNLLSLNVSAKESLNIDMIVTGIIFF